MKKNPKIEKPKDVGHFLVQKLKILISARARVTMHQNAMLVARKASCCVANAFSTGLKVIWPRSSLKMTKMSKKRTFAKSSRSQWVKQGEQGWRSGESARLPPLWPRFDSRTRRHMWVGFVVGSLLCSKRFFSGYSGFPLLENQRFQIPIRSGMHGHFWTSSCELLGAHWVNKLLFFFYKHITLKLLYSTLDETVLSSHVFFKYNKMVNLLWMIISTFMGPLCM